MASPREPAFLDGVALVIGGSGGIGRAVCTELAKAGSDVALSYRKNHGAARDTAAEIERLGRTAQIYPLELEFAGQVEQLVDQVASEFGSIHSLVYAAGPSIRLEFVNAITPEEWAQVFSVDVNGCFNLVRACLPHFKKRGGGAIVAVTTTAVARMPVRDTLSGAPRAAIEMLMRGVAKEEGRFGVRANCVQPGWVDAGLGQEVMQRDLTPAAIDANLRAIPMRRFGLPQEIAAAAVFLLSSQARYITGQSLAVDGGMQL